ncbi:hypothetical protein HJFPF1_02582 [Paramyrothecium foliicola]|nr:hypothetical protein HJFPF1_02582 [Paramyrothecium foliicola]
MVSSLRTIAALAAVTYTSTACAQVNEQWPLAGDYVHPGRDARLSIYNNPKFPCSPERGQRKKDVHVPVNVCVAADFTLDNNVHIAHGGLCPGGKKTPYLAMYPTNDCTGGLAHPTWYEEGSNSGPGHCLSRSVWSQSEKTITPPIGHWSMIFRCADSEASEPFDVLKISQPAAASSQTNAKPRPITASVSDSACYVPGSAGMEGAQRLSFKRTEADNCIDIEPRHRLKVYRNALCSDGSEALFARYAGTGCKGQPEALREVGENLMATNGADSCIDMGGEKAASYAFWCTGELQSKPVETSMFPYGSTARPQQYSNMKSKRQSPEISAAVSLQVGGAIGVVVSSFSLLRIIFAL